MEEHSSGKQMVKIRNFEKGFMATHLINLGAKLGIFESLNKNKEGLAVSDLASTLGLHEPYVKIWCQTAYYFEILDSDDQGRFKLQPFLDEILGDKTHFKNYLANISCSADLIGPWFPEVPDHYRTGGTTPSFDSAETSKAAYATTKNIPLVFLFMIFPKLEHLKQSLEQGVKFLDIGCGNGNLIIQLAQTFSESTFVGINPDRFGIEAAKKTIAKLGLEQRISVENMGGEDITYSEEFDMATMVVTLHEISPEVRGKVAEKVYQALKSGGKLLVLDLIYPSTLEDFRNPIYDYGVLDQFYEACIGTVHLNREEQDELLTKVGFKNIQRMPIGKGIFDFLTAEK
jgi:ubiquinone/menaquinone biosynthesis C-methylase UbiE